MSRNPSLAGQRQGSGSAFGDPADVNPSNKLQQIYDPQSQAPASTHQSGLEDQHQAPSQWKRRCREELDRSYRCREPNCTRRYEAWRSLQRHLKVDHNIKTRKAEYVDEDPTIAAPASQNSAASNTSSSTTAGGWALPPDAGPDDGSCATSSPESTRAARPGDEATSLDSIVIDPSFDFGSEDYHHGSMSPAGVGARPPLISEDAMRMHGGSSFYSSSTHEVSTSTTTTTTSMTTTTVSYESVQQRPPESPAQAAQLQRKPSAVILNAARPLAMRKPLQQQQQEKRLVSPPYGLQGGLRMPSSGGEAGPADMAVDMSPRGEPGQVSFQQKAIISTPQAAAGSVFRATKPDLAAALVAKKKAAIQRKQAQEPSASRPGAVPAQQPTEAASGILTFSGAYMGPTQLSLVRHNSSPPRLPSAMQQQFSQSLPTQPTMPPGPQAPPSQASAPTMASTVAAASGLFGTDLRAQQQQLRRLHRPQSLNDQELEMLLRGTMPTSFAPPQLPPTDRPTPASAAAPHAVPPAGAATTASQQLYARPRNASGITVTPPSAVASAVALQQAGTTPRYHSDPSLRTFLAAPFMALNAPSAATAAPSLSAAPTGYVDNTGAAAGAYGPAAAHQPYPLYAQLFPQQWPGAAIPGVPPLAAAAAAAGNPTDNTTAQAPGQNTPMARPLYPGWSQEGMGFPTLPFAGGDMLGVPGLWGAADASLMVARQFSGTGQEHPRQPSSGPNDGERTNQS